jgi:Sulfite exporter TauE/SafE.
MELSSAAIVAMVFTAFSIGIAKSGLPGLVTVITPFVAMTMPSKIATGIMLPLLIVADIVSVIYWRRKALWQYLGLADPRVLWQGWLYAFLLLRAIDDATFTPIMGWLIIIVSLLSFGLDRFTLRFDKDNKVIPLAIGLIAGIFNMLANGAAPVLALYLLALKINKEDFVGTNAWFFLVINIASYLSASR